MEKINETKPVINGLEWDTKNVTFEEKTLLDWNKSKGIKEGDWRLPTNEELAALAALGSTWDEENQGRWFGPDSELLSDSKKSVFLPADGFRNPDCSMGGRGYSGYYWSASPYDRLNAYYLNFNSNRVYPVDADDRTHGFSVRLVKDLQK
ncbi:MAG: DUF1566 domain-containing protein [Prevotella sp.]|jgi:uncharacterized protein (TIGR02145 family)|nr:DUF1566 domain-containing protein [Prevotella sp.]